MPRSRLSITQSRTSITNLRDRITALDDIDQFIAARSTGRLLRAHQRKALKNDLWLYVQDLHKVTEAYRAEFPDLANGYLDHVGRRVLRSLPAPHKLAYLPGADPGHAAARRAGRLDSGAAGAPGARGPAPGRLRADLPFRANSAVPIPDRVFRPHWRDLDPIMQVDDIGWDQGSDRLVVTGRANVPSVDIPRRGNTSKIVVLRPPGPESTGSRSCCPSARSSTRRRRPCPSRTGTTTTGPASGSRSAPGGSRDRRMAVLHACPQPRRVAARPGCTPRHPAPRSGRGPVR